MIEMQETTGDKSAIRNPQSAIERKPRGGLMEGISRNVVVLGAVSFFTDVSSQMIAPIRILFLVLVLRTPLPLAGLIEGIAQSAPSLIKIVAGRMSNRPNRRKPRILFGYGLSSVVMPLLAFVSAWPLALLAIFLDRVGKGVRGGPRDAMLADSTPRLHLGKAFGFHRSLDTLGAAIGPLLTAVILLLTLGDLRAVFLWTLLPGVLSVLVIVLFLRERPGRTTDDRRQTTHHVSRFTFLGLRFWLFTAICAIFALGSSSHAFAFLRTAELEISVVAIPLIYFVYNLVYAALATPLGALSDRWGRIPVLMVSFATFGLLSVGWAYATQSWQAWLLFAIYGIYAAATEGVARAFVTDLVPTEKRGTALGWFSGIVGFAALPANIIGGWLWSVAAAPATFIFGAWMSGIAVALTIAWLPWLRPKSDVEMATATS